MVSGRARSDELSRVIQELTRTATPLIGTVINRMDVKGDEYYSHYYSYYGSDSDQADSFGAGNSQLPSVDHAARQFGSLGD